MSSSSQRLLVVARLAQRHILWQQRTRRNNLFLISQVSRRTVMHPRRTLSILRPTHPLRFVAAESSTKDSSTDDATAAAEESSNNDNTSKTETSENNKQQQPQDNNDDNDDDDDEIPEWQNPRHHGRERKIFKEDFAEGEEMPVVPLPPLNDEPLPHLEELANDIVHLNMLEMNELVHQIAEHFGFQEDAAEEASSSAAAGPAAQEEEAAAEEVKTVFDLKLEGFDSKAKIKVIKEVRGIAGLGLKEAKEMVEGAPKVIKKELKREEAEELKKKLEEVGATVEIV